MGTGQPPGIDRMQPVATSEAGAAQPEPAPEASTPDAEKSPSKDEPTAATTDEPASKATNGQAADSADAATRASEGPGAPARHKVGVVYEPDESPDGFPLEYGNIIVGLPKSDRSDESAEASPESPGVAPEPVNEAAPTQAIEEDEGSSEHLPKTARPRPRRRLPGSPSSPALTLTLRTRPRSPPSCPR